METTSRIIKSGLSEMTCETFNLVCRDKGQLVTDSNGNEFRVGRPHLVIGGDQTVTYSGTDVYQYYPATDAGLAMAEKDFMHLTKGNDRFRYVR